MNLLKSESQWYLRRNSDVDQNVIWIKKAFQMAITIWILQVSPPKFRYFADQNVPKGNENKFRQFSNTKISQTVRTEKVDEKNEVICLVPFFPSWVMVLKLPKIIHFCKFVLTSSRNLNLLKQFIYVHLKDLIMLFRKIVHFIGVWATVKEMLKNQISSKVVTLQKLNKIHQLQTLISSKL